MLYQLSYSGIIAFENDTEARSSGQARRFALTFDRRAGGGYHRDVDRRKQAADAYQKQGSARRTPPPADRPESGADRPFLKTGVEPAEAVRSVGEDRAAKLLILLGAERAADVLSKLEPAEVEKLSAAIINTHRVRGSEALELLERAGTDVRMPRLAGGAEVARSMLVAAFGEEEGERIFFRSVPNAALRHFQFLDEMEPHQVAALLKHEAAPAIAVILTHIRPEAAAAVLETLEPEVAREAIRRIGRMERLDRDVVVRIEEALRQKIRTQGRQVSRNVEGPTTLAAILRGMPAAEEKSLLEAIAMADPELGESVRDQLYTAEIVHRISERDLQELLRDFGDEELAMVLKGKEEQFRAAILRNVSERRRELITDEYQRLGPQRRSDVEEATRDFVLHVRRLAEEGRVLVRELDDYYT